MVPGLAALVAGPIAVFVLGFIVGAVAIKKMQAWFPWRRWDGDEDLERGLAAPEGKVCVGSVPVMAINPLAAKRPKPVQVPNLLDRQVRALAPNDEIVPWIFPAPCLCCQYKWTERRRLPSDADAGIDAAHDAPWFRGGRGGHACRRPRSDAVDGRHGHPERPASAGIRWRQPARL